MSNKLNNLKFLKKTFLNTNIIVPKFFGIKKNKYYSNKEIYLKKIYKKFKQKDIIIRSSSKEEDQKYISNAGKFLSIVVLKNKKHLIENYLEIVLNKLKNENDEIIIQEYIKKVDLAGVFFSREINNNLPYYQINFDTSKKTNHITSGIRNDTEELLLIHHSTKYPKKFQDLIQANQRLSKNKIARNDIEFGYKSKKLYLFQLRKIPLGKNVKKIINDKLIENTLFNLKKKIETTKFNDGVNKLFFFSNMADWNPAEILGVKPSNLSIGIYENLITNEVWKKSRIQCGYDDTHNLPLMFNFLGIPYIDVIRSILSFFPKKMNLNLKNRIFQKYINYLFKNPQLHDQIEFELLETCYAPLTEKRLSKKISYYEILKYKSHLIDLTKKLIDLENIKNQKKNVTLLNKKLNNPELLKPNYISNIFTINELVKKYGTLTFSNFARYAFVAERILRDFKSEKYISELDYYNFYNSLKTITYDMYKDLNKINNAERKKNFKNKYGHLRPSTYDIDVKNYSEGFEKYFSRKNKLFNFKKNFNLNISKEGKNFLKKSLKIEAAFFEEFAKKSIIGREFSKFIFSKGIDKIFQNLKFLFKEIRIDHKNLKYLDYNIILNNYNNLDATKLKSSIIQNIRHHKNNQRIKNSIILPEVIKNIKDIYILKEKLKKIRFITNRKIIAKSYCFSNKKIKNYNILKNKIIIIENADPGYDFVFNYNISGIITKYGSANSHMSIRCLENNIPAAIGIGDLNFEKFKNAKSILIDCDKQILKKVI